MLEWHSAKNGGSNEFVGGFRLLAPILSAPAVNSMCRLGTLRARPTLYWQLGGAINGNHIGRSVLLRIR